MTRQLPFLLLVVLLVAIRENTVANAFTTPLSVAFTAPTSAAFQRFASATTNEEPSPETQPADAAVTLAADAAATTTANNNVVYEPVFDFSDSAQDAVSKFDRIDDAIMGGISTSSLRAATKNSESYASWAGVCRTDGGGFCGTRTLPFRDGVPLSVGTVAANGDKSDDTRDGFYLRARLASDNEPHRRVWKLTTRVENVSRSEQLYQAMFEIPSQKESKRERKHDESETDKATDNEWKTIRVPFDSFVQVRGPRIVENGPPLDVTGGLFQIGMTMSKFQIATNATEFENFRPGYFELQIQEIGVYTNSDSKNSAVVATANDDGSAAANDDASAATKATAAATIETPLTLTKKEAERNKPTALKILFPIAKLFFNEKR